MRARNGRHPPKRSLGRALALASRPNDYGEGLAEAAAWAAFSLSFATFAVACWSRSASFCRFGLGVGVGLTLALSSEREHAPRIRQQEREIAVRMSFMMKNR